MDAIALELKLAIEVSDCSDKAWSDNLRPINVSLQNLISEFLGLSNI